MKVSVFSTILILFSSALLALDFRTTQKLAEKGNAEAQFNLGLMYERGDVVVKDYELAAEWFTKSAKQGYLPAESKLFGRKDNDDEVGKNANDNEVFKIDKVVVERLTTLAYQGNAAAQYNLGVMYANGDGVIENDQTAVEWYTKAAYQGNAAAQYNLGVMYAKGDGVIEDFVASYAWFSNAKTNEHKEASKALKVVKDIMTKEQIALGQALATNLYQKITNRDDESPVHTQYD
jgi:TPR repeat protein